MNSSFSPGVRRAFRRAGKLVIEIDEPRFCADAFLQSDARVLDRDAFLAYACEQLFDLLHDDGDVEHSTWWLRLSQAIGQGAADAGAGVRRHDGGEDRLPMAQPPELFPDEVTRALLGQHVKEVA